MRPVNPKPPYARAPISEPEEDPDDDEAPPELSDDDWEALIPDDDYEPLPEHGDFWTDDE